MAQWKRGVVIVQGSICRRVMHFDSRLGESRYKLLHPTNTLNASDGRAKRGSIPARTRQVAGKLVMLAVHAQLKMYTRSTGPS